MKENFKFYNVILNTFTLSYHLSYLKYKYGNVRQYDWKTYIDDVGDTF